MNKNIKKFLINAVGITAQTAVIGTASLMVGTFLFGDRVSAYNENKATKENTIKNLEEDIALINQVKNNTDLALDEIDPNSSDYNYAMIQAIIGAQTCGKELVDVDTDNDASTITYEEGYELYKGILVSNEGAIQKRLEITQAQPIKSIHTDYIGTR